MDNLPRREIKSYVRREGRLTPAQANALENLSHEYVLNLETLDLFNFNTIFGNSHPVILEIGFGMGASLLQQAAAQPEMNFLGVEVHRPGVGALLSGIGKQQLSNIRIVNDDAVMLLKKFIANNSLSGIQIFFPDPWPKKRHHKRRLIQPPFVNLLTQKLKTGGFLHCATDWENYAEHILEVLKHEALLRNTVASNSYAERPTSRPLTKFENRGIKLGHGVWDIYFIKI